MSLSRFFKTILSVTLCLAVFHPLFSQSLRPNTLVADRISYWQHRGELWGLSPLMGADHAETALLLLKSGGVLDPGVQSYLERLPRRPWQLGAWLESENVFQDRDDYSGYRMQQRLTVALPVTPWLEMTQTLFADNRLDDDPDYLGKRQNNLAAYFERSVVTARYKGFEAHVGRDHLVWGPGRDAALLISDNSRPLDQIRLGYRRSWLRYEFVTATLDASRYTTDAGPDRQRRFLSGHRLEIQPSEHLLLGISEAILFAEPGAGFNYAFFNPVILYHAVQLNGPDVGNTLGSINLAWMPSSRWMLYGDLMIDDVQLEQSVQGDEEPDAYGVTAGTVWSDPFAVTGLDATIEYTRITNRTYNGQGGPWEKWLHRRQPLGHSMGNDFDRLLVGFEYWPIFSRRFRLNYERIRQGEGRIEDPFTAPWLDLPKGESYSEPFPFGIVETTNRISVQVDWQGRSWGWLTACLQSDWIDNAGHIEGESEQRFSFRVGAVLDVARTWTLP